MTPPSPRVLETPPEWTADEMPVLPGSPPSLEHTATKRFFYLIIGILVALCGGLGNGLITANLTQIQGEYGLTPSEVAWLPAVYVMANISSNLLLFKARQQFGLRWFSEAILLVFMLVIGLHIFVQTYPMALLVRAISGFVGAPLSSLGMYYVMQAFSKPYKLQGLYIGFGISQLAVPLAWIISPFLSSGHEWSRLYTFELGLSVCCFAMVVALKLPRSLRIEVFEKKDIVTFLLLASGFSLLCAVLVQGSIVWWRNSPTLAYWLIAAFGLLLTGFSFEHYRKNPLIMTRWLGSWSMFRFILGAFLLRFIMSEQSYAVVNFLKSMGIAADQFVGFYTVILFGMVAGSIFSAVTFSRERTTLHLLLAITLVFIASGYDSHFLTSDLRPQNFYFSQCLVAFAGGLFIGPLVLIGFGKTLQQGPQHVITFIILFAATQNFGGLIGSAFYSTVQQQRTQLHKQLILQQMDSTDPLVSQRLNQYQGSFVPVVVDSQLSQQQAQTTLNQVVTREAQTKAFDDIISINMYITIFLMCWGLINIGQSKYQNYMQRKAA